MNWITSLLFGRQRIQESTQMHQRAYEVTQKGIALSNAVKNVDSTAEIFGPVLYGFSAYYDFQGASDWNSVKSGKSYSMVYRLLP